MKIFGNISYLIGLIFIVSLAGTIGKYGFGNSNIEHVLLKRSEEINRQLPMMVDSDTRCEITVAAGNTLIYKFTLVNISVDEIDVPSLHFRMEELVTKNFCKQKDMVNMLNDGIDCRYMYFDRKGELVTTILITKETCYGYKGK